MHVAEPARRFLHVRPRMIRRVLVSLVTRARELGKAAGQLPLLFPDRTTEKIQYDFPRTLWDREWVMYLLVGLLSAEWLTRKLLKLA